MSNPLFIPEPSESSSSSIEIPNPKSSTSIPLSQVFSHKFSSESSSFYPLTNSVYIFHPPDTLNESSITKMFSSAGVIKSIQSKKSFQGFQYFIVSFSDNGSVAKAISQFDKFQIGEIQLRVLESTRSADSFFLPLDLNKIQATLSLHVSERSFIESQITSIKSLCE